jgi:hypothetical protein
MEGQATSAGVTYPYGVCGDTAGTIFITILSRVLKVDTSGTISLFAGDGASVGDYGPATSAIIVEPRNCVLDSSANVYFADYSKFAVRVIAASNKIITRYAGMYTSSAYSGDGGPATSAKMNTQSMFINTIGDMFVGDDAGFRVRKIAAGTKIITNFAGSGVNSVTGMGGKATSATIPGNYIFAAGDNLGDIFIGTGKRLFRVDGSTNIISVYSGNSFYFTMF